MKKPYKIIVGKNSKIKPYVAKVPISYDTGSYQDRFEFPKHDKLFHNIVLPTAKFNIRNNHKEYNRELTYNLDCHEKLSSFRYKSKRVIKIGRSYSLFDYKTYAFGKAKYKKCAHFNNQRFTVYLKTDNKKYNIGYIHKQRSARDIFENGSIDMIFNLNLPCSYNVYEEQLKEYKDCDVIPGEKFSVTYMIKIR